MPLYRRLLAVGISAKSEVPLHVLASVNIETHNTHSIYKYSKIYTLIYIYIYIYIYIISLCIGDFLLLGSVQNPRYLYMCLQA
jgi:hypothetical protein